MGNSLGRSTDRTKKVFLNHKDTCCCFCKPISSFAILLKQLPVEDGSQVAISQTYGAPSGPIAFVALQPMYGVFGGSKGKRLR